MMAHSLVVLQSGASFCNASCISFQLSLSALAKRTLSYKQTHVFGTPIFDSHGLLFSTDQVARVATTRARLVVEQMC